MHRLLAAWCRQTTAMPILCGCKAQAGGDIAAQPRRPDAEAMTENDDALLTAAERARQAEERLVETRIEDPAIVPKAHKVYQRAEEVDALAEDAATGDAMEDGEPGNS
jgi:hypothetical protein